VLNVQMRVTPTESLKAGLAGENGVVQLSEPESVASAVTLAVVDGPFEEHEVPLDEVQVSLKDVVVTSSGRHSSP
ncbi:MAG TPA: hypothetical protein VIL55_01035, partial [Naasia sp.]